MPLHELADAVEDAVRNGHSADTIRREVERVMDECDDQFTTFDPPGGPAYGQTWEDRGTVATVEKVMPGGGAILKVNGLRHPVQASYFTRARLVSDDSERE